MDGQVPLISVPAPDRRMSHPSVPRSGVSGRVNASWRQRVADDFVARRRRCYLTSQLGIDHRTLRAVTEGIGRQGPIVSQTNDLNRDDPFTRKERRGAYLETAASSPKQRYAALASSLPHRMDTNREGPRSGCNCQAEGAAR